MIVSYRMDGDYPDPAWTDEGPSAQIVCSWPIAAVSASAAPRQYQTSVRTCGSQLAAMEMFERDRWRARTC